MAVQTINAFRACHEFADAQSQSKEAHEAQHEGARIRLSSRSDNGAPAGGFANDPPTSTSLVKYSLPESDVVDTQMFALFYDTYLPSDIPVWRQVTYLRTVAEIVPNTALFKLAKRTLGLAHLAASTQNVRIQKESVIWYSRLLNMLRISLQQSVETGTRTRLREILSAMALLTHMSDHSAGSEQTSPSWVMHLDAARRLLDSKASRLLNVEQPLDKGIVRHISANSFVMAVAKRQTWSIPECVLDFESQGVTDMMRTFQSLPKMLQETDWALCIDDNSSTLEDLVRRLQLVAEEGRLLFPDVHNPRRMHHHPTDTLGQEIDDRILLTGSSVFSGLYSPMSHVRAIRFLHLAIMLAITQCTILRIWTLRPESMLPVSEDMRQSVRQDARQQAVHLCKITPSLIRRNQVVSIQTLRLCVMLARNIFEQQCMNAELDWCNFCLSEIQVKLERLGREGAPTLCKIADVIPGITEAGRYGSTFNWQAFNVGR